MTRKEILRVRCSGVTPDDYFVLVSEETLEKLKDFDVWKKWKNKEITLTELETYEDF